jgi:hypothetical protein
MTILRFEPGDYTVQRGAALKTGSAPIRRTVTIPHFHFQGGRPFHKVQ